VETQIEQLSGAVRSLLQEELVGAYLHGSAVLGGLQPHSDIDLLVVAKRRTSRDEKRALVDLLLESSRSIEAGGPPRPIELDIVVASEIRPWRYPPTFDFHFDELLRTEFESGELEPWPTRTNADLASVVTMVLVGDRPLFGPPAHEIFDPVPRADYVHAILRDTRTVDQYLDWDTRNVVLTLARIWTAVATDEVLSKDSAASWALPRLPEEHRRVLERAQAVYRGDAEEESWDAALPEVRAYAAYLVSVIERALIPVDAS
jgi:predicted nucleotidyltransferase